MKIKDNDNSKSVRKTEENGTFSFGLGLHNFIKKEDYYVSPIQYFIPQDNNNLVMTCPLFNNCPTEFDMLSQLKSFNDFEFRVVCRDFDKEDISNTDFINWAMGLDKSDLIRKSVEEV